MSIEIDKEIAIDLIHSKIEMLDSKIQAILKQWKYSNIDDFIGDVKKGYCFYFESNRVHQISNVSDKSAQLLWVTSPPQM